MYYRAILQLTKNLEAIEIWLDKAEEFATARKFDIGVLLNGRLAPDMQPFIYQVQSASDYIKGGAAWLSGQKPPKVRGQRTDDRRVASANPKDRRFRREYEGGAIRECWWRKSHHVMGSAEQDTRRRRLPAANGGPERVLPYCHGLRHPPP